MATRSDPIIEEVRRIRQAYAAEHGNDIGRIVRDYQRRQKESGRTYVTRPPRKPTWAPVREAGGPYRPQREGD